MPAQVAMLIVPPPFIAAALPEAVLVADSVVDVADAVVAPLPDEEAAVNVGVAVAMVLVCSAVPFSTRKKLVPMGSLNPEARWKSAMSKPSLAVMSEGGLMVL